MVESKKLGRRIVDAVSMFIVTAMSLLLLLYVGYGEGRRTYEQIELEKLTAQGYLIQNTIEKFLRDDLPLKQFPGFATIARPLVDGLADVDATTVYDHDRRELFAVKPILTARFSKGLIRNGNRRREGALALQFQIGRGFRGSAGRGFADGRRQRDADGTQGQAGGRTRRGADDEALVVVLDLGLGQRVQIGDDLRP